MIEIVFTNRSSRSQTNFPVEEKDIVFGPYATLEFPQAAKASSTSSKDVVLLTGVKKDGAKDIFAMEAWGWLVYSVARATRVRRAGFVVREA